MTIQELFIASNNALRHTIEQVSEQQLALQLPPGMSSSPTTLEQAIRYHTYDDAWVPDVLLGKTAAEVGDQFEPLLSNSDVIHEYMKYQSQANNAVKEFTNLEQITHLSYGDFKAREYLQHVVSFRAFRSFDIAKLIGADTTMDPELVDALTEEFSPVVDQYRQMGVFPAALNVPSDADPQTKLLAMVGRTKD